MRSTLRQRLRLRRKVRTTLEHGSVEQHKVQLPAGIASVARRQHAAVEERSRGLVLRIRDLLTRKTLHRWLLPRREAIGELHMWRWGSQALAIPYCAHGERGSEDEQVPGALIVETATGSCASVDLLFHNPFQHILGFAEGSQTVPRLDI